MYHLLSGITIKINKIMENLIKELKEQLEGYSKIIDDTPDAMNYEDTESYGFFLGKKELLEELIPKLEKMQQNLN